MERPCRCERVRPGEPFDASQDCRLCWLFAHKQEYRTFWGGDANVLPVRVVPAVQPTAPPAVVRQATTTQIPQPEPLPKRGRCLFLGDETGERGACCGAPPLFACEIFGRATLDNIAPSTPDKPIGCCRVCTVYQQRPEPLQTPMPGFFQKAKNFALALLQHAASGMRNATEEQQEARMAICRACPEFTADGECRQCGCVMAKKVAWAEQACPIGKWEGV